MKKLLILLILFFGSTAYAFNPFVVFSGEPCSSCTPGFVGLDSNAYFKNVNADGDIMVWKYTASVTGACTLDKIYVYINNGVGNDTIGVIYTDNAGEPGTLVAKTNSIAGTGFTAAWISGSTTTNPSIIDGASYWVGFQAEESAVNQYQGDVSSTAPIGKRLNAIFGTIPSTWDTSSDIDLFNAEKVGRVYATFN